MSDRHEIMGEAIRHIMHVLLHSEKSGEAMTTDDRIAYALGFYMSSYLNLLHKTPDELFFDEVAHLKGIKELSWQQTLGRNT